MLALLAVTIGLDGAMSIGLAVAIASALVAAVRINEKQGGRLTSVEKLGPRVKALEDHDKAATEAHHRLDKRLALLEQDADRSGIYRKPKG